jgi:1,2-dihydroxy-3-keto-5-methylthiopentene dioxygenase
MAILRIPKKGRTINHADQIKDFLSSRGIFFDQWKAEQAVALEASQEEILNAYDPQLRPFMLAGGYTVADVINVHAHTENLLALRKKFLSEHTHTEDEIRFFVQGEGLFWFNLAQEDVFNVLCQAGDLISVPKNTKHWFDLGPKPSVKVIRIFIDPAGWVPHYTGSKIDLSFNPVYEA